MPDERKLEEIRRRPPCGCGIDIERLREARQAVAATVSYLRDRGQGSEVLISPSIEYNSGVLHALGWVLGIDPGGFFAGHLGALQRIEPDLARLQIGSRNGNRKLSPMRKAAR